MKKQITDLMTKLDHFFTEYLGKKAPAFPANIKEYIVKYSPYLIIFVLIFSFSSVRFYFYLPNIINLISLIVLAVAVPGLFTRKKSSWNLMYYSTLISSLYILTNFNLLSLIINTGISLYILFQIRNYYQN